MTICNTRSVVAPDGPDKLAASLRCKSWFCPYCGPQRREQLIDNVRDGEPNRLLTLTSRRTKDQTANEAARALVGAWKIIFKEIRKQHGQGDAQFIAIFEDTENEWPHLHIPMRSLYVPQEWIADRMRALTNSPVCFIDKIKSKHRAAKYVSKYVSKAPDKFGTLKRYWQTPGYDLRKEEKRQAPRSWEYHSHDLPSWIDAYRASGFEVQLVGESRARAIGANLLAERDQ